MPLVHTRRRPLKGGKGIHDLLKSNFRAGWPEMEKEVVARKINNACARSRVRAPPRDLFLSPSVSVTSVKAVKSTMDAYFYSRMDCYIVLELLCSSLGQIVQCIHLCDCNMFHFRNITRKRELYLKKISKSTISCACRKKCSC